jgi:hypothetical protein
MKRWSPAQRRCEVTERSRWALLRLAGVLVDIARNEVGAIADQAIAPDDQYPTDQAENGRGNRSTAADAA